jgi:hypothetical protein
MSPLFPFDAKRVREEYLSAEQYRTCCDVIWSADRRAGLKCPSGTITPGAVLYAKADHYLPLFQGLQKTRAKVTLVTAESDIAITPEIRRLMPPQAVRWFSTNAVAPDVEALPLGLGNSYCTVTTKAPVLAEYQADPASRTKWLYVNFRCETNPAVRQPVMEHFRARPADWLTVRGGGVGPGEFLAEMTAHRFVLCPPGNGIDTHRMWEALYCKTIPVVQRHPALAAFEDLPILFVEDLRGLTLPLLRDAFERFQSGAFPCEKLFLPWWKSRLMEAKRSAGHSRLSWMRFLLAKLKNT